jgi:hypothetical protein
VLRRVGLVALGLLLAVASLEVLVRVFVPVSDPLWVPDPVVGTKLAPRREGRSVRPGLYDVRVRTNSQGFHDREHSFEKAPGVQRVAMLGDSMIEAIQVRREESVSALLENRLTRAGVRAETINLGASGFGTAREYLMLEAYGLRYRPDVVLLFFVGNDVRNNSKRLEGVPYYPYPLLNGHASLDRDAAGRPRFTPIVDRSPRLGAAGRSLAERWKTYRVIRTAVESSPGVHRLLYRAGVMAAPPEEGKNRPKDFGFFEVYRVDYAPEWAEAWALTEAMILETHALATRNDSRFGVVLVPHPWELYPQWWEEILTKVPAMRAIRFDLDKPARRLAALLEAHHVPYLNLLPAFRERAASSPPLYIRVDGHWTADGHRLATELAVPFVTELLRKP